MKELLGKKIYKVYISDNAEYIKFSTWWKEDFIFNTYGDCCNEVWVNHISGIDVLFEEEIMGILLKECVDVEPTRQEVEEKFGYTLITRKGYCDIEVRNSHNGYYGGDISFLGHEEDEYFKRKELVWKEITEDF